METFSALLALCEGNSPVTGHPNKGQWHAALVFSLICTWINGWVNNREAGDLRRRRVYYDVMAWKRFPQYWPFARKFTGGFPHKGPKLRTLYCFFVAILNKLLNKQSSCHHFLRYDAKMTYVKWNVCLDIQGQWVSEWEDIGTRGHMFALGVDCWNAPQRITGIRLCFMTNCVACHNLMLPHIDGSVQDCSISIANALEILQFCTKPSIRCHHPLSKLMMECC